MFKWNRKSVLISFVALIAFGGTSLYGTQRLQRVKPSSHTTNPSLGVLQKGLHPTTAPHFSPQRIFHLNLLHLQHRYKFLSVNVIQEAHVSGSQQTFWMFPLQNANHWMLAWQYPQLHQWYYVPLTIPTSPTVSPSLVNPIQESLDLWSQLPNNSSIPSAYQTLNALSQDNVLGNSGYPMTFRTIQIHSRSSQSLFEPRTLQVTIQSWEKYPPHFMNSKYYQQGQVLTNDNYYYQWNTQNQQWQLQQFTVQNLVPPS